MTLGKRIKQLRMQKAISQEKLAEELNVSRSAIAKWETDGGIPQLNNLLQLAKVFDVSLDELAGDMQKQKKEKEPAGEFHSDFGNQHYDIELVGWNDGVRDVAIVGEDKDFLFYGKAVRENIVYGIIGKRYITSIFPAKGKEDEQIPITEVNRDYFCSKPVAVELAKKEGLLRGFLDFRDDDYCAVVIERFEELVLRLQFGREINISEITKVEELSSY